jgi:hypothetical protein
MEVDPLKENFVMYKPLEEEETKEHLEEGSETSCFEVSL